jgi:hypothetical protein
MKFINLTPHAIKLNDGTTFPPSGVVARVAADLQEVETIGGVQLYRQTFGDVEGLPEQIPGTIYIVSALVFSAVDRSDCVAPATGSKETIRDEAGQIVSVPGFVTKM